MKVPTNTKPWIQGIIVGAVATMIIGFNWGGWYTGGTYDKDVAAAKHDGAVEAFTPACVEKFKAQPDAAVKMADFTKASSWEQSGIVEKGGFAKMAGPKLESDVARACAGILANPPKS